MNPLEVEGWSDCLNEEEVLFTLLGRAIYGMPDKDLISAIVNERVFSSVPFVDEQSAQNSLEHLLRWSDCCAKPFSDDDFEEIRVDYARLFVGAQKVAAPLWESVYFNRERMVFQEQTLRARATYQKYKLQVENYQHEPDDHLAFELLFIAHLAHLARTHLSNGEEQEFLRIISDQRDFLTDHLLSWINQWRDVVCDRAKSDFYRGYAMLICLACDQAQAFTTSILERKECCTRTGNTP
jgi:TorA maturation chaperone TorD